MRILRFILGLLSDPRLRSTAVRATPMTAPSTAAGAPALAQIGQLPALIVGETLVDSAKGGERRVLDLPSGLFEPDRGARCGALVEALCAKRGGDVHSRLIELFALAASDFLQLVEGGEDDLLL